MGGIDGSVTPLACSVFGGLSRRLEQFVKSLASTAGSMVGSNVVASSIGDFLPSLVAAITIAIHEGNALVFTKTLSKCKAHHHHRAQRS